MNSLWGDQVREDTQKRVTIVDKHKRSVSKRINNGENCLIKQTTLMEMLMKDNSTLRVLQSTIFPAFFFLSNSGNPYSKM
jgi:hypothetical protein